MKQKPFRARLAKVLKTHKLSLEDILWVVRAYHAGRVLRKKTYRPRGSNAVFFYWNPPPSGLAMPKGVTTCRMLALVELWGMRPATRDELDKFGSRVAVDRRDLFKFEDIFGESRHFPPFLQSRD